MKKIVTRQDLVECISDETGLSTWDVKQVLDGVVNALTVAMQNGQEVKLRGFGTLKVVERKPKYVRNVTTGESFYTAAKKAVVFRPGKDLKFD